MEQRQAQAGLALSGAIFALALPAPAIEPDLCRNPVESVAVEQHTTAVRCEGRGYSAGILCQGSSVAILHRSMLVDGCDPGEIAGLLTQYLTQ